MRRGQGDDRRRVDQKTAILPQRVLKAGDWYIGGDSSWHPELLQLDDVIEFPVYEDDNSSCGHLIARVTCRYKEDRHGRAFDATPLACSSADFRGFMEKDLMKRSCRFHLCRTDGEQCGWSCAAVHNYLHVDSFTRLKDHQVTKKVAAWTASKKKTYDIHETMSVESDGYSPAENRVSFAPAPKNSRAADGGKASESDVEQEEEPPLRRRRKGDLTAAEEKAKSNLDDVLISMDGDAAPADTSASAMSSRPSAAAAARLASTDKVAELKARLAGRAPPPVSAAAAGNAILAERAVKVAAGPRAPQVPPPGTPAGDAAALRRLLSPYADSGELVEDSLEMLGGELGNRRMVFRRIAREQPGKLSLQTIHDLRVKLEASDVVIPDDEYAPIFLRYLLQVYTVHNPVDTIGPSAHRELRHYAEIADGLMRGNLAQVLDLTTQAFKAKMLALEDGNWDTARWLQLIPEDTSASSVPESDVETARRIQAAKMKELEREQRVKKGSSE